MDSPRNMVFNAYDNLPAAIVICEEGVVVYENQALRKLLMVSVSDLSGRQFSQCFSEVQPSGMRPHDFWPQPAKRTSAAADNEADNTTWKMRRSDGSVFDAEISVNSMEMEERDFILALIRDVSRQKVAEKTLHKKAERLRFLLDHAELVLWELDAETLAPLFVSGEVYRMQGFTPDEILSMPFEETLSSPEIVEQIRARVRTKLAEFKQKGNDYTDAQSYSSIIPRKCKDGGTVWTEVVSRYIRNPETGRVEIHGVSRYVTEKVVAQRMLQDTKEYLHTIVNTMPSVLIGVDSDGHITLWNDGARRLSGIQQDAATGHVVSEVWPEAKEIGRVLHETIRDRKKQERFSMAVPGAAPEKRFNIMCFPVQTKKTVGAVLRMDDVTEQMAIQELLVKSEKMLSLGGLAAGMAHELNNPLGGILQMSQLIQSRLLRSAPNNEKAAESIGITMQQVLAYADERKLPMMLEQINDAAKRAAKIIRNMLDYARDVPNQFDVTDMACLIDETVVLAHNELNLNRRIDFGRIAITRDYASDLPGIHCDAGRIQQVLLNLFKNSAQAFREIPFEPGRWRIDIRLRSGENTILMEVEDNGPGMSDSVRESIFEPFFSTKKKQEGTGLGLPICKFIIEENHGGEIRVTSSPGKGTCFHIQLPITKPKKD